MTHYLAFIGPPGSGKTTQIRRLAESYNPNDLLIASIPRLVRQQDDIIALLEPSERTELHSALDTAQAAKHRGELAPIIFDRLLFQAVTRVRRQKLVVLDGCPRGEQQAHLFLTFAVLAQHTKIMRLGFPQSEADCSIDRQLVREVGTKGHAVAVQRYPIFQRKTQIYITDTQAGLAVLERAGLPITRCDATDPPESIHDRVCILLCSLKKES